MSKVRYFKLKKKEFRDDFQKALGFIIFNVVSVDCNGILYAIFCNDETAKRITEYLQKLNN